MQLPPLRVQSLASSILGILPAGTLSGDFHVHGGASFDSAIPDRDRVVSFLATGVDVIIATDHDVVTSYAEHAGRAGGVERDGHHLRASSRRPTSSGSTCPATTFPKTLGHFNFWPLTPDFVRRRATARPGTSCASPVS